ncbi:MAG TPA: spore coat protein U domain-containing protein [Alphaproteobacteria bacterium]|nr:spore coat protein U domain-containing protein [Alphaproteobacteria bacterium]
MSPRGLLLALFLAILPLAEAAACKLQLNSIGAIRFAGRYDPFAAAQMAGSLRIALENKHGSGTCTYGIGVDGGQNGIRRMSGQDGAQLRYDILGPSNRPVADAPANAANGLVVGTVPPKGRLTVELYPVLPAGQMVPPQYYADRVTATVYTLSNGQPSETVDSQAVDVQAQVAEVIQSTLQVGGVRGALDGRTGTLDFGELRSGASKEFGLEIAGNIPYRVTLQSENRGQLLGIGAGNAGRAVPYALALDGRTVPLGGAFELPVAAPTASGRSANQHGFTVQIGDLGWALAGDYADNITVTVSAQ